MKQIAKSKSEGQHPNTVNSAIKYLVVALATLLLVLAASAQNDDSDVPVLKRRPPASESTQPPEQPPSPEPSTGSQPATRPEPRAPEPRASETPMTHDHHAEVMRRGAEVMGFDQQTTTHQFILTKSGGVIRVTSNDPDDTDTATQINLHLRTAATQFARGDFSSPRQVHAQMPPGVAAMQRLRDKITYTAHPIAGGAELIISSFDARAVQAIHQFLEFQIRDHGN